MSLSSREHLKHISDWAEYHLRDYGADYELHNQLCDMLKSALAEPVKNCEVGTAEEQSRRFDKVCSIRFTGNCAGCQNPLDDSAANGISDCALFWAQMPYEEGDAK